MLDVVCFTSFLHPPHFLPAACNSQYRNCDESAFSRKILPDFVGTRQENKMRGPFIFEKTTVMATVECGLAKSCRWKCRTVISNGLLSTLHAPLSLQSALAGKHRVMLSRYLQQVKAQHTAAA